MKSSVSVSIDRVAEQIAEDETGELMASLLAGIVREFDGHSEEFGMWMQSAMNDARHLIPQKAAEEWADSFIARVENAALQLY